MSAKRDTAVDDLLNNAMDALVIASDFGSVMPLPLVSTLIQTAQVIVSAAQVRSMPISAALRFLKGHA